MKQKDLEHYIKINQHRIAMIQQAKDTRFGNKEVAIHYLKEDIKHLRKQLNGLHNTCKGT